MFTIWDPDHTELVETIFEKADQLGEMLWGDDQPDEDHELLRYMQIFTGKGGAKELQREFSDSFTPKGEKPSQETLINFLCEIENAIEDVPKDEEEELLVMA